MSAPTVWNLAAMIAFGAASTVITGWMLIPLLGRVCGERIDSASEKLNQLHAQKANTPGMGGLLLLPGVIIGTLMFSPAAAADWAAPFVIIGGMLVTGAVDDWIKNRRERRGLRARTKFACQLGTSLCGVWLLSIRESSNMLPMFGVGPVSPAVWILVSIVALVGTVNGANLTDGLDGLLAGTSLPSLAACSVLLLPANASSQSNSTLALMALIAGGLFGFLYFNRFPARVFAGDTGSHTVGAVLALGAIQSGHQLLLPLICLVPFLEALSVIFQVTAFRFTGKRPLRCSPLHHHFVFGGTAEPRIVKSFVAVACLGALTAVLISL